MKLNFGISTTHVTPGTADVGCSFSGRPHLLILGGLQGGRLLSARRVTLVAVRVAFARFARRANLLPGGRDGSGTMPPRGLEAHPPGLLKGRP